MEFAFTLCCIVQQWVLPDHTHGSSGHLLSQWTAWTALQCWILSSNIFLCHDLDLLTTSCYYYYYLSYLPTFQLPWATQIRLLIFMKDPPSLRSPTLVVVEVTMDCIQFTRSICDWFHMYPSDSCTVQQQHTFKYLFSTRSWKCSTIKSMVTV